MLNTQKGALEMSETQVRDAMIPRSQMVVVPINVDIQSFLPRIIESGHSRFPVHGELPPIRSRSLPPRSSAQPSIFDTSKLTPLMVMAPPWMLMALR